MIIKTINVCELEQSEIETLKTLARVQCPNYHCELCEMRINYDMGGCIIDSAREILNRNRIKYEECENDCRQLAE